MPDEKSPPATLDVAVSEAPQSQIVVSQPVAQMIEAVIAKGVTSENVAVMERLVELYERMQLKDAEKQFNAAFVALQADLPVIVASTIIPNRGKYERFEDVMRVVGPLLVKHGFTVSFSMDFKDTRILETCHLKHVGGHSQSNSFAVRSGRADTDTQADCKAATTAKRNALLNCLNVVIRQDVMQDEGSDARNEGSVITKEQAAFLKQEVVATGSDESAFLRFAGAEKYEEILSGKYEVLASALSKKPRK